MPLLSDIMYKPLFNESQPVPLFMTNIQAGFPNPADNDVEQELDLNEYLVKHPAATFFVRVEGDSMINAGIFSGDLLIVDRSLTAIHGKIIVAVVDNEFTVKRLLIQENGIVLAPENPAYSPIKIKADAQFQVWGVVTYVIHKPQ